MTDRRITANGSFTTNYALDRTKNNRWMFDKKLASKLIDLFKNKTVVDLGCGIGHYVKYFVENNISCKGYDGIYDIDKLSNGIVDHLDLTKPINIPKFDWILCLEVGEHIPKEYEKVFINNIKKTFNKGVILSWAIPGQFDGSVGHVNNQNNKYIIDKLSDKLIYKKKLTKNLREHVSLKYLKNTLMAFESRINML